METLSPEQIVKRVSKLYRDQLKKAKKDGYYHPILHASTIEINMLISKFESLTGENWDTSAKKYLR